MKTRRKSIRLFEHELRSSGRAVPEVSHPRRFVRRIPRGESCIRPGVAHWSNCSDTAQDLVHYMRVQRKTARWVQLGDNHRSLPPLPELTAEQTEVLVGIYYDNVTVLENGSDVLSYDEDISELIAKEFHEETDLYIEPYVLVTKHHRTEESAVSCQRSLIFPRPKRVAASTTSTKRSSECSPTF